MQLAVGSSATDCLGETAVSCSNTTFENIVHVETLNDSFLYVIHVRHSGQLVLVSKSEANILNTTQISVLEEDIEAAAKKNSATQRYKMEKSQSLREKIW